MHTGRHGHLSQILAFFNNHRTLSILQDYVMHGRLRCIHDGRHYLQGNKQRQVHRNHNKLFVLEAIANLKLPAT